MQDNILSNAPQIVWTISYISHKEENKAAISWNNFFTM